VARGPNVARDAKKMARVVGAKRAIFGLRMASDWPEWSSTRVMILNFPETNDNVVVISLVHFIVVDTVQLELDARLLE
jgi:hypothetical protein